MNAPSEPRAQRGRSTTRGLGSGDGHSAYARPRNVEPLAEVRSIGRHALRSIGRSPRSGFERGVGPGSSQG